MGIASVAADVSPMSTAAVKTALQSSDRISIKDSSALIVRPWHDSDGDHVEFSQLYGIAGLYEMLLKTLSGFVPETPDDNLNFEKIRYKRLISRLTEHDLEYSKLCEDMIGEKDREIARLSSELSELKAKYAGISSKADAFEDKLNKNQVSDKGLMFESSENDLYPDERKDVILKLLEKERDAMKDDATLSRSRKFDVISDVLAHNFPSGTDERIICAVRDAFSGGRLTKADIGRLCEAGVIVAKEGRSAHYRCTMDGEDRYCVTLSATPSDSRSGRNAVSEFANLFFGY